MRGYLCLCVSAIVHTEQMENMSEIWENDLHSSTRQYQSVIQVWNNLPLNTKKRHTLDTVA